MDATAKAFQILETNYCNENPKFLSPDEMKLQFQKLFPDPNDFQIIRENPEIVVENFQLESITIDEIVASQKSIKTCKAKDYYGFNITHFRKIV